MPTKKTIARAREDQREGKSPSTQAGEFVREEMKHIRNGKHGARSSKQAIAIGLSKARRAGVDVPPSMSASKRTRAKAARDLKAGHTGAKAASATRSASTSRALQARRPCGGEPEFAVAAGDSGRAQAQRDGTLGLRGQERPDERPAGTLHRGAQGGAYAGPTRRLRRAADAQTLPCKAIAAAGLRSLAAPMK